MDVPRTAVESIFTDIVESVGYKTTVGPTDKKKVTERLAGKVTTQPRARLARAAWRAAGILTPLAPTPGPSGPTGPPPASYLQVAPRATNMEGGSNVQYCMFEEDGSLRPGVRRLPYGKDKFTDESGAIYSESLQDTSIRDESAYVPGLPGSRSMNGRSPCQCLRDAGYPGDPTKNTGAWTV